MKNNMQIVLLISIILLLVLSTINLNAESGFLMDNILSIFILIGFYLFRKQLNQDFYSFLFISLATLLHNLGLYGNTYLNLEFEHYMHFFAGFTIGIFTDRFFGSEIAMYKKIISILIFSLGIGTIGEIGEWVGFMNFGFGDGGFQFGEGDKLPWTNTIVDSIYNFIGGLVFSAYVLIRGLF